MELMEKIKREIDTKHTTDVKVSNELFYFKALHLVLYLNLNLKLTNSCVKSVNKTIYGDRSSL